jgi:hypothetical protein
LVGEGVAPVLVVEVGVACTPVLTDVTPVALVVVAVWIGPPGCVVSVASFILVKAPPVGDAGAEACWTCAAASV